jgi:hypothetical protein
VLKNLSYTYRDSNEFKITSLDFLNALYKVTPSKYHVLIDDWFKRIMRYDLAIKENYIQNSRTEHTKLQ